MEKNDSKKVVVLFQCVYCSNECVVPKLSMDETPRRLHCDFGLRCAGEHGRALHGGLNATSVCGWLRPRSADAILKHWDREVATIKSAVATFMVRGASDATKSLRKNTIRIVYSSGDDNPRKTTGDDIRRNSGGDDNPRKAHRRKNPNQNLSLVGNNVLKQCLKKEKKKKGIDQGTKKRKGKKPIC